MPARMVAPAPNVRESLSRTATAIRQILSGAACDSCRLPPRGSRAHAGTRAQRSSISESYGEGADGTLIAPRSRVCTVRCGTCPMLTLYRRSLAPFSHWLMLGTALSFLFIIGAIALGTHSLLAFFSVEGLVIVVGGVIAVAYMSFEAEDVRSALAAIAATFRERGRRPTDNLHRDMAEIIAWASMVKEMGMRRLEWTLAKQGITDPFVKYGLNMVVTGYASEDVRAMMETAADATYDRESVPVEVLQSMTSLPPAFGRIGTLIGMVATLCSLDSDVAGIGASLSGSFLSTLYGVVSARMVYMPAAAKQIGRASCRE